MDWCLQTMKWGILSWFRNTSLAGVQAYILALKKASTASTWSVSKIANSRKLVSRVPPFPFKATLSIRQPPQPLNCTNVYNACKDWGGGGGGLGRWGSGIVNGWPHLKLIPLACTILCNISVWCSPYSCTSIGCGNTWPSTMYTEPSPEANPEHSK